MTSFLELLDAEFNNEETDENNVCLISYEKLEDNYITLYCGHKFNYEAIFNEVKQQKRQHNHVSKKQIKCPYCRKLQTGILPPRENYEQIWYVNKPNELVMKLYTCNYTMISGKRKGQPCGKKSHFEKCKIHLNKTTVQKEPCSFILTRGKRKGEACGKKSKENMRCSSHIGK